MPAGWRPPSPPMATEPSWRHSCTTLSRRDASPGPSSLRRLMTTRWCASSMRSPVATGRQSSTTCGDLRRFRLRPSSNGLTSWTSSIPPRSMWGATAERGFGAPGAGAPRAAPPAQRRGTKRVEHPVGARAGAVMSPIGSAVLGRMSGRVAQAGHLRGRQSLARVGLAPRRECRRPSRTAHWRPIDTQRRPARRVMLDERGSLRRAPSSRR
jgi:hypothetical protein